MKVFHEVIVVFAAYSIFDVSILTRVVVQEVVESLGSSRLFWAFWQCQKVKESEDVRPRLRAS